MPASVFNFSDFELEIKFEIIIEIKINRQGGFKEDVDSMIFFNIHNEIIIFKLVIISSIYSLSFHISFKPMNCRMNCSHFLSLNKNLLCIILCPALPIFYSIIYSLLFWMLIIVPDFTIYCNHIPWIHYYLMFYHARLSHKNGQMKALLQEEALDIVIIGWGY